MDDVYFVVGPLANQKSRGFKFDDRALSSLCLRIDQRTAPKLFDQFVEFREDARQGLKDAEPASGRMATLEAPVVTFRLQGTATPLANSSIPIEFLVSTNGVPNAVVVASESHPFPYRTVTVVDYDGPGYVPPPPQAAPHIRRRPIVDPVSFLIGPTRYTGTHKTMFDYDSNRQFLRVDPDQEQLYSALKGFAEAAKQNIKHGLPPVHGKKESNGEPVTLTYDGSADDPYWRGERIALERYGRFVFFVRVDDDDHHWGVRMAVPSTPTSSMLVGSTRNKPIPLVRLLEGNADLAPFFAKLDPVTIVNESDREHAESMTAVLLEAVEAHPELPAEMRVTWAAAQLREIMLRFYDDHPGDAQTRHARLHHMQTLFDGSIRRLVLQLNVPLIALPQFFISDYAELVPAELMQVAERYRDSGVLYVPHHGAEGVTAVAPGPEIRTGDSPRRLMLALLMRFTRTALRAHMQDTTLALHIAELANLMGENPEDIRDDFAQKLREYTNLLGPLPAAPQAPESLPLPVFSFENDADEEGKRAFDAFEAEERTFVPNPFDDDANDEDDLSELPEPGGLDFDREVEAARQRSKGRQDRTPERDERERTAGGKTPGSENIDARLRALIGVALGLVPRAVESSTKALALSPRTELPKIGAPLADAADLPNCSRCGAPNARGNCATCKTAYCDVKCLVEDWDAGDHQQFCNPAK